MENKDKETFLRLDSDDYGHFAVVDHYLRSGVHIQDHITQKKEFRFIENNFDDLYRFYEKVYQVKLCVHQSSSIKFYYLDYFEEQKGKLQKSRIDAKHILLSIFLYKLQRIDKHFSAKLSQEDVIEILTTHPEIKPKIQKIILGSEQADTSTTQNTIEKWVKGGLKELNKIGWIHATKNDLSEFELLPAIERITLVYTDIINNIENL